jgi:hypothetical protein
MAARFTYDAETREFSANVGSTDYLSYKEDGYSIKIESRKVDMLTIRNALEALLAVIRPLETVEANEDFSPEYLGVSETEVE